MKAAELKINLIKGRRYLINGVTKEKYTGLSNGRHRFVSEETGIGRYIRKIGLLDTDIELLPNVPDENTPIDTLVRVWDEDNQSKAAINRSTYLWFAGISKNKEYPFMVFYNDGKSASDVKSTSAEGTEFYKHAEIVEVENESES